MATWGPDKRKARTSTSGRAPARSSLPARQTSQTPKGQTAPLPRNSPARRQHPPEDELDELVDWRREIAGREPEFIGVGFIAAGVLIGLAVYLRLAGPLGRGVDKALGWLTGLGRFAIPVALVGVGVALIRKGVADSRFRLVTGWTVLAASLLGTLHVVRGPDSTKGNFDVFGKAGGWLGAIIGEPLKALLATAGALVVLIAALIGSVLLLTGWTIKTLMHRTSRGVGSVVTPVSKAARKAFGDMTTLSSEREAQQRIDGPVLYDVDAEDADGEPASDAAPKRKRAPKPLPPPVVVPGDTEQAELDLGPGAERGPWKLPPGNFLTRTNQQAVNRAEVEARGNTLQQSLESHGVETRLVGMTVGPTVTRYELELGAGVKVARVTSLQRDIAYAMAATDVRILAPIPGRSAIGVEVPNHTRQLVSLGDLMTSPEAKTATHPLDVAIGKDIAGRSVFLNLATTPHLLIAGATGAGKSSGINCIITSLLMRTTPDQVKLILIDPKQVEMGQYARLPHLLTQPVTNPKKAANALSWAVREMERRYDLLSEVGYRDIGGYNAAFDRGELQPEPGSDRTFERMPFIVVVVDELNDLMMVAARDVEESITRIAQKARAVGVHLIIATQRPSVNVITGVIKANVPARMAFAVSSLTDSRVILDQPGAEKLVGKGDMLLLPGSSNVAQRIQGSWVSEEEVRQIVAFWRRQAPEVTYVEGVESDPGDAATASLFPGESSSSYASAGTNGDEDDDVALLRQAMELVVRSQLGSTSMLQRKLKVGFARAGRIMDLLEQRGVVGPSEGSKARAVLMTVEEFELLQRGGD
jgi:S-DNA-T family DNA segregation ATPase FtsK/SpoIIIE